jgi:hypothetical protein
MSVQKSAIVFWALVLVSMLAVIIKSANAKPIDMEDVIGDDGMGMLKKMLEYLADEDFENDKSSVTAKREAVDAYYEPARGNKLQSSRGDGEMCMLPMKKGVCRALLPRWRLV